MKLSKRLELVASFVKEGGCLADIGTDHGYIPIALVTREVVSTAIAMDVRRGPLDHAAGNIRAQHLEGKIKTRLSDGLDKLESGEAQTVVIAGMGGELVIHILDQGRRLWDQVNQWVLSPQSELHKVRRYLEDQGFCIVREDMVKEDGKYYTVMDVSKGRMECLTDAQALYGKSLIQDKNPVLAEFLKREQRLLEGIVKQLSVQKTQAAGERSQTLRRQLGWIEEALYEMQ